MISSMNFECNLCESLNRYDLEVRLMYENILHNPHRFMIDLTDELTPILTTFADVIWQKLDQREWEHWNLSTGPS
jgi:hypothetical protein